MPVRVNIPPPLLASLDRKARALKISRNRLILLALEKEVGPSPDWPPGFFERLSRTDPALARTVDEVLVAIRKSRTSKGPVHS